MHNKELWEGALALLRWVAPFSFVFCLIYAVRDAVSGGKKDVVYGLIAALSLLVLVVARR